MSFTLIAKTAEFMARLFYLIGNFAAKTAYDGVLLHGDNLYGIPVTRSISSNTVFLL